MTHTVDEDELEWVAGTMRGARTASFVPAAVCRLPMVQWASCPL